MRDIIVLLLAFIVFSTFHTYVDSAHLETTVQCSLWVSANGSDSTGKGTQQSPFQSLAKAFQTLHHGVATPGLQTICIVGSQRYNPSQRAFDLSAFKMPIELIGVDAQGVSLNVSSNSENLPQFVGATVSFNVSASSVSSDYLFKVSSLSFTGLEIVVFNGASKRYLLVDNCYFNRSLYIDDNGVGSIIQDSIFNDADLTVIAQQEAEVTVDGCFLYKTASYYEAATVLFKNSVVSEVSDTGDNGALYVNWDEFDSDTILKIHDSLFVENQPSDYGLIIVEAFADGTFEMIRSTIANNSMVNEIYNPDELSSALFFWNNDEDGHIIITDSKFINNTVDSSIWEQGPLRLPPIRLNVDWTTITITPPLDTSQFQCPLGMISDNYITECNPCDSGTIAPTHHNIECVSCDSNCTNFDQTECTECS